MNDEEKLLSFAGRAYTLLTRYSGNEGGDALLALDSREWRAEMREYLNERQREKDRAEPQERDG